MCSSAAVSVFFFLSNFQIVNIIPDYKLAPHLIDRKLIKKMKKIVMKVQMNCQKCRTQALKHVAEADGK
ncbi:hypothetical protein CICLE_v10017393mg [Citrus x clementina]|uniref:Uncharacterized protein n=1 Tax=Citrus clementina TaxID=85681 RepID=V4WAA5_CITCL|nr:hypothetical protein CICLE_v10017393mg [Citrus x clementina]